MKRGIKNFLESIVFLVILLVLVQTFLEDFAVLMGWSWDIRRILVITGFFFDLFFTVEFLFRLYYALARREGKEYLLHGKGWIDFVAAVPLLMFNSGPAVLAVMGGTLGVAGMGGLLNVLKTVKVVRIARVLRLLRILKVFKQIKFVDSPMAQRHVSRIVATVVTAMIIPVMVFSMFFSFVTVQDAEENYRSRISYLGNFLEDQEPAVVWDYCQAEKAFLVVRHEGETIFSRYQDEAYRTYFGPTDYSYHQVGAYEIFLDARPMETAQSRSNFTFFLMVVFVIAVFLIFYSPHFAMTVTDPIIVMRKGIQETTYNLEVKIPRGYTEGDDVYQLARAYNDVFLPMKLRNAGETEEMGDIQVDNFDDLFEGLAADGAEKPADPETGDAPDVMDVQVPEPQGSGSRNPAEDDIPEENGAIDWDEDLPEEEDPAAGDGLAEGDDSETEDAETEDEGSDLDLDLDDDDLLAEMDEDLEKDLDQDQEDRDKG